MDVLSVLRVLLRHGRLVVAGALAAGVAALVATGALPGERTAYVGVGQSRVMIDTPRPLAADAHVPGITTIGARTAVLADRMASERFRRRIAADAGVPVEELSVVVPSMAAPRVLTPMPDRVAKAAVARTRHVLTVAADTALPIVTFDAAAPRTADAGRLLSAATGALVAATRSPHRGPGLVARPLGAARLRTVVDPRQPRRMIALAAALLAAAAWLSAIVVGDAARRALGRRTSRQAC
jgi:hypothetical protein